MVAFPKVLSSEPVELYDRGMGYLRRQLLRRGVSGAQMGEALCEAQQLFVLLWLEAGEPAGLDDGKGWPALRRLLDRAVYQTLCALPHRTTVPLIEELLEDCEPVPQSQLAGTVLAWLSPGDRLLVKLKQGTGWYASLPEAVGWERDESAWLQEVHDRPVAKVTADFLMRLRKSGRQTWNRVPSREIAWLLGRASAAAVDRAYSDLCSRIRERFTEERDE